MKGKVLSRNSNVETLLRYVHRCAVGEIRSAAPVHVAGTVFGTIAQQVAYFEAAARIRPKIVRCYFHFTMSLTRDDRIDDYRLGQIAEQFMALLEFPLDTPYIAFRHTDSQYPHVHIVASRVSFRGKLYSGDSARPLQQVLMKAIEHLERSFRLEVTSPWRGRNERLEIEPLASLRNRSQRYIDEVTAMQSTILEAIEEAVDWDDLGALLHDQSISVWYTDHGVSFGRQYKVKASLFGTAFMSAALAARGLSPFAQLTDDWARPDDFVFEVQPVLTAKPSLKPATSVAVDLRHFDADALASLFDQAMVSRGNSSAGLRSSVAGGSLRPADLPDLLSLY